MELGKRKLFGIEFKYKLISYIDVNCFLIFLYLYI